MQYFATKQEINTGILTPDRFALISMLKSKYPSFDISVITGNVAYIMNSNKVKSNKTVEILRELLFLPPGE